jgi:centromeric protein E
VAFSGAEGERFVETCHINKSLLTLGNVVEKLVERSKKPHACVRLCFLFFIFLCRAVHSSVHIPYRDSKLTRILQPALGGNARTLVVCTVSPAAMHLAETHNTLLFASRAKQIHNHIKINEVRSTECDRDSERERVC